MNAHTKKLVLASTSRYRQELLKRLGIEFTAQAPSFDEEKHKDSRLAPQALAEKLAFGKAQSLACEGKVIIGGDQLVAFENQILGKSHSAEKAFEQLKKMQGKTHQLITAVCVFDGHISHSFTNITLMKMKSLSDLQIKKYIELDNPVDCAGSYKIELHGIGLFEAIETSDFTAIQGLPLIELSKILKNSGLDVFN